MDEQLQPDWRKELESLDAQVTRPRYKYTWSWNPDGSHGLVYGGDKIHSRKNYRWKHPVHEVLTCTTNEVQAWTKLEIHHHPDETKSRGQYFNLLAQSVLEDPADDRNCFYNARELFFHNKWAEAIQEFKRHLNLPKAVWKPERAASMRYLAKMEEAERESWLLKAIAESPNSREPRVDLAQHYYTKGLWLDCYAHAYAALRITEQPLEYLVESDAWGYLPHDLIAIACHNSNKPKEALEHGQKAVALAPWIDRLQENVNFYKLRATAQSTEQDKQMLRGDILKEASRLTHGDRNKNYGDPLTNHQRIAALWSVFLEAEVTPEQAAIMLALVKVARLIESPDHLDSFIDGAAYFAIAGEIAHCE